MTTDLAEQVRVGNRAYSFLRAMIEAQIWDSGIILEFLEKPWKWAPEYTAWIDCGQPAPNDGPAFAAFESRLP